MIFKAKKTESVKQKIVTIGGGAGSFMVLSGLKNLPVELHAIVNMTDDGGSTGVLRDELGVLPPGDIRQCLVALSTSTSTLRELFNYRYVNGGLKGHSFGNIFLSTLEKITGGLDMAVKEAGKILRIKGFVYPVTLKNTTLVAELKDGRKIVTENKIYHNTTDLVNLKKLFLKPSASINQELVEVIKNADKIIINPGDLYSSIIPNFLVKGLKEAIKSSKAKVVYVGNLMTKPGQTDGFTLVDYVRTIENYLGKNIIDFVIYNKEIPNKKQLKNYLREGEVLVPVGDTESLRKIKFIGGNLLSHKINKGKTTDVLAHLRSVIRHDSDKLAEVIYNL